MGPPIKPVPDYTYDQWKQILVNARARAQQEPNNPKWQQAMTDARTAMKQEIARQERSNRVLGDFEMQEAQDPGFAGTLAGSALEEISRIPGATMKAASFLNPALLPFEAVSSKLEEFGREQIPRDITETLETGKERHPVAGAIGEFAPVAAPLLAGLGGVAGRGMALARQTKGLQRDILAESLAQMRSRAPQAGLRTELLEQQVARGPLQNQAMIKRIELMEEQLARSEPTMENLQLRNELMKLKLEAAGGEGVAALETAPLAAPASPAPAAPINLESPTFMRRGGSVRQEISPISGNRTVTGQNIRPPLPEEPILQAPPEVNPLSQLDDLLASGRSAEGLPALGETVENIPGAMGQKAVQFGEGSPLSAASQAEIKTLLGQLQAILGKKGGL